MSEELTFNQLKSYVKELNEKFDEYIEAARDEVGSLKILNHSFEGYKEFNEFLSAAREWDRSGQLASAEEQRKKKERERKVNNECLRFLKPITTLRKEIAAAKETVRDNAKRGRDDKVYVYSSEAKEVKYIKLHGLSIDDLKLGIRQAINWGVNNEIELHHLSIGTYRWKVKVWKTNDKQVQEDYILNKSIEAL